MKLSKATLILNPVAGNRAYKHLNKIETLIRQRTSLVTYITKKRWDALAFAQEIFGTDLIIIAGGDGTINEVVNGILSSGNMKQAKIPIALIPIGTVNVLAKELEIPENIDKAIDLAFCGLPKKISIGKINDRYFMLMAGTGFDGNTVYGVRNDIIKKISGRLAHIISGFRALYKYNPPLITIKTSQGALTGYTAVISNVKCYGGYYYVTPEASITEPMLDVCILQGKSRRAMLRFVMGVLRKKHLIFKDVTYGKYSELEVTSDKKVHIQTDGDYFGTLPIKISVVQDAISLIW